MYLLQRRCEGWLVRLEVLHQRVGIITSVCWVPDIVHLEAVQRHESHTALPLPLQELHQLRCQAIIIHHHVGQLVACMQQSAQLTSLGCVQQDSVDWHLVLHLPSLLRLIFPSIV